MPNPVRIVLAVVYASAVVGVLLSFLRESPYLAPIAFIALGLPLAFRLVPRNWVYGMRTPRTLLSTHDTWYRQNVITGVVMTLVGVVWMIVVAVR